MNKEQLLFNALVKICEQPNRAYDIAEAAIVEYQIRQQSLSLQNYRGSEFCKLICQSKVSLNNHDFTTEDAKTIMQAWVEAMPIKEPKPRSAAQYKDEISRTNYLLCERIISCLPDKSSRIKTKVRTIYEFAQGLTKFDFYYDDLGGN